MIPAAGTNWHLNKEVSISLIFAMLLQFAGTVWFVSKLDARLVALEAEKVAQAQRDGRQDTETKDFRTESLRRYERIEEKLDRLIERPGRK